VSEQPDLKSVEQHVADILSVVEPLPVTELGLLEATGCVLAEEVSATTALPSFDNSSMDGYAVVAADVAEAAADRPVRLPVVADIAAGDGSPYAIRPGMCARIMTGAPVPAGADAIVPVEWTDAGTAHVQIHKPPPEKSYIRRVGEDVRPGDIVARPGTRLGPAAIGLVAAVGRKSVKVRPRPRVVAMSTGSELTEPGRPVGYGSIWDSNSFTLTAAARQLGCLGFRQGIVADEPQTVLDAIDDQLVRADALVTSGGVSMGAHDVVKEVLSKSATMRFEKVAMQPGMPQGFGTIAGPGPDETTPIFTLPGNPVSSYVSFQLFVRPALRKMQGLPPDPLPSVRATLTGPLRSPGGRRSFIRAQLVYTGSGYTATPVGGQGSHQLAALAAADSLVVVPEWIAKLGEGDEVDVMKLPGYEG
jgi:molybdopterin molybdotransferase